MRRSLAAAAACLVLGTSACSGGDGAPASGSTPAAAPSRVVIVHDTQAPPHSSTTQVVKEVLPSVVNIKVEIVSQGFFGQNAAKAEGSGVVISPNGVILTNNHVVQQALQVRVALNDGRTLRGDVVGNDPEHDLAVVKVHATGLKPVTVGNSSKLELGDTVIALGFPLNLGGPTVTEGIVSGLDRTVNVRGEGGNTEHLKDLIQTDAAINPGNSGGALVDAQGRLVGINTAAASAGAAENIGFAIAIDKALPIVKQIIAHPNEQGAFMGVQVVDLDKARYAAAFNVPKGTDGAGVAGVIPGSPAERTGIRPGDIITSVEGHDVNSSEDLTSILSRYAPGDRVTVGMLHNHQPGTVTLTLIARPVGIPPQSPSP